MFLKRSIILAVGVLLFIAAYIIYFDVSRAQMESRFKEEREKYNVEGQTLTASSAPMSSAAASTPAPDSSTTSPAAPATPDISTPAPATPAGPDAVAAPAAPALPDSGSTPAAPAGPDNLPAPAAPAMPDTNAAPATAPAPNPSSTMDSPRIGSSPFFQLASYHPSDTAAIEVVDMVAGQTTTPAATAAPAVAPTAAPVATPVTSAPETAPAVAHPAGGEGKVIVLLYHQFKAAGVQIPAKFRWTMNADVFESEMKYIHDNGYHVIPMSDVLKFLKHEITVPSNSVCITIDDGYKSAVVFAAPVLKKYGFPWTFFIYPDFVTTAEGAGAVSWNDLLALQADGVDIESHSMTHPNLKLHKQKIKGVWHDLSPDEYAAWLNNETAGSKALLEQKMGKPIIAFAYPYGEYNTQVENAAIAAGYEAIFTVADNPVHATTPLHSIGRYTITLDVLKNFTAYLRQGALALDSADPAPGATTSDPRPVITATLGYNGTIDPKSIETSVRDFGDVRHDFDPQTNTLRLYLPRDLIAPVVLVNIRVKDATSGQYMVANWHFNYEPGPNAIHAPMTTTNAAPVPAVAPAASTSAPPEPLEKTAVGTPMDAHTTAAPAASPH